MRWRSEGSSTWRWLALLQGGLGLAWLVALRLAPRAVSAVTTCGWRENAGIPCPTCGGTRASAALVQGDVAAAAQHNALVVMTAAALAAWCFYAAAASIWPRLRRTPQLGPLDRMWLGGALTSAVAAQWLRLVTAS